MTDVTLAHDETYYFELLALSAVPIQLHEGLVRYLVHGIRPGSFLSAVLANDAANAIRRADAQCWVHLGDVFAWLIDHAPYVAWGSEQQVDTWIAAYQTDREKVV